MRADHKGTKTGVEGAMKGRWNIPETVHILPRQLLLLDPGNGRDPALEINKNQPFVQSLQNQPCNRQDEVISQSGEL